jgi:redox-sensing transcriptional repressor
LARISDKVIGRLTRYRALLTEHVPPEKRFVYSHELASMMRLTPSQVRRDLMHIGYFGVPRHGYEVDELVKHIGEILGSGAGQKIALVGVGNLGRALIAFLEGRRSTLRITSAFDSDPLKVNRLINGVPCHPMDTLDQVVAEEQIRLAILCVPGNAAQSVAERLTQAGIKGILNFAPVPLRVPVGVYIEDMDVTSSLEKVAYFTTHRVRGEQEG